MWKCDPAGSVAETDASLDEDMQHRHRSTANSSVSSSGAALGASSSSSNSSSLSLDDLEDSMDEAVVVPPAKKKLTVMEAFSFLAASKQVRCLALMALAQGISTNLLEVRRTAGIIRSLYSRCLKLLS
jgi:hypothetical protein